VFVEMPQHKLSDSAQAVNGFPLNQSFGRAWVRFSGGKILS
jgi:hypothetical protein